MQMGLQSGRIDYSPSSLAASASCPREDPKRGFGSFAAREEGDTLRVRTSSFADHYTQAHQFFSSLTVPEQNHLVAAFTFELSKVETKAVRARMLGQLANVEMIAQRVTNGLGHQVPIVKAPTTNNPERT